MHKYQTIDEYIAEFPPQVQEILQKLRQTIQAAAPEATEAISYGIPTFKFHGNLVHFGGFKDHISFFPASAGVEAFYDEVKEFVTGKGTIQFPLDKQIPYPLITKITKFRYQQNAAKKK